MSNNKIQLPNRLDAQAIIEGINVIANNFPQYLEQPALSSSYIAYDGETHSVTEILEGYNPFKMVLTGDVEVDEEGVYITTVKLRSVEDKWIDGSTDDVIFIWSYGIEFDGITSWSGASDNTLVKLIQSADEGRIDLQEDFGWQVGDTRTIHLSAMAAPGTGSPHAEQDVEFVLMHKGLYKDSNDKEVNFIVGMKDCLLETGYMNDTNTNSGSWDECARRAWCNSSFYNSLPSTFKSLFKQFKTVTAQIYDGSSNQTSLDYFALPAAKEVFGGTASSEGTDTSYSNLTEFNALTQFDYYKTAANRIKKLGANGSANKWWERSPFCLDMDAFCTPFSDGTTGAHNASSLCGLAPFGCI